MSTRFRFTVNERCSQSALGELPSAECAQYPGIDRCVAAFVHLESLTSYLELMSRLVHSCRPLRDDDYELNTDISIRIYGERSQ